MIPIVRPTFGAEEHQAINETLSSGWITQGPRVKEFEEKFAEYVNSPYACAVSNCTVALQLALLTVGVQPGNIVITVSHSFIATANSVRACGAEPVFIDIDPASYCMSSLSLEKVISQNCTSKQGKLFYNKAKFLAQGESPLRFYSEVYPDFGRIAAILLVHQIGIPCDMSSILEIASRHNLPVIEDAACALGAEINIKNSWQKIGAPIGDIACFSFHPRKILTTGDGGMLTTKNADFDRNFRLLRQHGMNISDRDRHNTAKVTIEEYKITGFNFRLTDLQAAIGIPQLARMEEILRERRRIAKRYQELLFAVKWLSCYQPPETVISNWQSFPIRLLKEAPYSALDLMQVLLDKGISTRPGIMNAHLEDPYKSQQWSLMHSEYARAQTILIPLYHGLLDSEIEYIASTIIALGPY